MADQPNPLKIHSIVLIVIGACLIIYGSVGMVQSFVGGRGSVTSKLSRAKMMKSQARSMKSAPGRLLKKPTSVGGAMMQARQARYLLRRILGVGVHILMGIATVVFGIFMLKQKNWARYAGYTAVAFTVLWFAALQGATAAHPQGSLVLPIILSVLVAGVASKYLWDLLQEEFAV